MIRVGQWCYFLYEKLVCDSIAHPLMTMTVYYNKIVFRVNDT